MSCFCCGGTGFEVLLKVFSEPTKTELPFTKGRQSALSKIEKNEPQEHYLYETHLSLGKRSFKKPAALSAWDSRGTYPKLVRNLWQPFLPFTYLNTYAGPHTRPAVPRRPYNEKCQPPYLPPSIGGRVRLAWRTRPGLGHLSRKPLFEKQITTQKASGGIYQVFQEKKRWSTCCEPVRALLCCH